MVILLRELIKSLNLSIVTFKFFIFVSILETMEMFFQSPVARNDKTERDGDENPREIFLCVEWDSKVAVCRTVQQIKCFFDKRANESNFARC